MLLPIPSSCWRWPFSQKESFHQKLTILVSWSWTSSFKNCEKLNFCCLSHPVMVFCYGNLSWLRPHFIVWRLGFHCHYCNLSEGFLWSIKWELSLWSGKCQEMNQCCPHPQQLSATGWWCLTPGPRRGALQLCSKSFLDYISGWLSDTAFSGCFPLLSYPHSLTVISCASQSTGHLNPGSESASFWTQDMSNPSFGHFVKGYSWSLWGKLQAFGNRQLVLIIVGKRFKVLSI